MKRGGGVGVESEGESVAAADPLCPIVFGDFHTISN
jgi:hypothetical protein